MMGCANAEVLFVLADGSVWSPGPHTGAGGDLARATVGAAGVTWVEDVSADDRFGSDQGGYCFQAGAELLVEGRDYIGVLAVYGRLPRPFSSEDAASLADLRDLLRVEIHSEHRVRERSEALEQAMRSERRLSLAAVNANLHVYEVDYLKRRIVKMGAPERCFETPVTYASAASLARTRAASASRLAVTS
jgi:hypothetical protein